MNAEGVVVLRQRHPRGTRARHVAVLVVTRMGATAVFDRALVLVNAEMPLCQDHTRWTGARHVAVLMIAQVRTAAVVRQTLVLIFAHRLILR